MTPSAFISYSWDNDDHKQWVRNLATRLRKDGIKAILDKWETAPGDQLPAFMEQAIRENQFVVIICTPRYKIRSESRKGGVGYEGDIMTAETLNQQNNRKFIPILRKGTWSDAAPSWLSGKCYIDLSAEPYSEQNYEELVRTLLGKRETPPPVGEPMGTIKPKPTQQSKETIRSGNSDFEDIKIVRVVEEEATQPRNDGTFEGALYTIPFALSHRPSFEWADLFVKNWDNPPQFSSMHRPRIASVVGATVVLEGTTIDEVERYHRDTLMLVVKKTNSEYREYLNKQEQARVRKEAQSEEHRKRVADISEGIKFD